MRAGVLTDAQLRALCDPMLSSRMISPYHASLVQHDDQGPIISYGQGSAGYDARAAPEWRLFHPVGGVVDPLHFNPRCAEEIQAPTLAMPPHSFALARTVERFTIPRDVIVICLGKSTYARCGIVVNVTPLEPGWQGFVTLELSNTTPNTVLIHGNQGICQFIFLRASGDVATSYADRKGKYQGQTGITYALPPKTP
jgi:dCTP deaminase